MTASNLRTRRERLCEQDSGNECQTEVGKQHDQDGTWNAADGDDEQHERGDLDAEAEHSEKQQYQNADHRVDDEGLTVLMTL